jgi:putative ABC transport system permease protein
MPLSTTETEQPVVTPARKRRKARRPPRGRVPEVITLAAWRVRETWRLLLITALGCIVAVTLVSSVPLYSDVSMSAGLRGVLSTSYQSSDVVVQGQSSFISTSFISATTQKLNAEFHSKLGQFLKPLEFSIQVPASYLLVHQPNTCSGQQRGPWYLSCNLMQIISASMSQASGHLRILQGRLPQNTSDGSSLEIALTAQSATLLHASVGSILYTNYGISQEPYHHFAPRIAFHVVGIFELSRGDDPYWHGNTYAPVAASGRNPFTTYSALSSNEAVIDLFNTLFTNKTYANTTLDAAMTFQWYYPLDPARITINDLDAIQNGITTTQVDVSNDPAYNQSPQLQQATVLLPSDILQRYHDRISVANIPTLSLLAFVLALTLFFVSMMADFLVERQSDSITILRSRGASRAQIFGSFVVQSVVVGLIALIAGPVLAALLVFLVIQHTLSSGDQSVLTIITGNFGGTVASIGIYALIAALASVIAMVWAIYRTTRYDILALRQEAARSTNRPLWQRINLDIVAIIITLTGFGIAYYITNSGVLDPQLRLLLLSPLTLLGTVFLLIACLLLFLRVFQLLLRLGSWMASRGRSAPSMLALAQVARSPRLSLRITLLFSLATAFVIFSLVSSASQAARIPQVAAYQVGADFSGTPGVTNLQANGVSDVTGEYRAIPGVASATAGYRDSVIAGGNVLTLPMTLMAVDTATFAQTSGPNWTQQDSSQPLSSLMSMLAQKRQRAIAANEIPAIVDRIAWQNLHLSPGATFTLNFSAAGPLVFVAEQEINSIPTAPDSTTGSNTDDVSQGAVMVDIRTMTPIYNTAFLQLGEGLTLNYIWIRAHDDPGSIASARRVLTTDCCLLLNPLLDRHAIISSLSNDPLYVDLLGLLGFGAATALLLALAGSLIASWLNARSRLTNFAVLRALGATPSQIASMLSWEQGVIYLTSLLLGLLFGALLAFLALPVMVFTSVPSTGASSGLSSSTFFLLQNVPPIQVVIPATLVYILLALVIICAVALTMMVRVVSHPSIGQTLRLNED